MRVGLQVWGQFVGWQALMDTGKRIEQLGFASLWSNDHFYPAFGADDGPVFEGWITLAGWAMVTREIPLGCLVSGAGYRNPALVVKMATTLDHASHGRVTLGLGAGWHAREHRSLGYALLKPKNRIARLEEAAAISVGLLAGNELTFDGTYFQTDHARNDPPPFRGRHLPLLIGGSGERFTLAVVARYADVWNGEGDPESVARKIAVLQQHCKTLGRDYATIAVTVNLPTPCVRPTRAEAIAVLSTTFAQHGLSPEAARIAAEGSPCVGPSQAIVSALRRYAEIGVQEVIFDTPHPLDLETLEALAGPIASAVSS